MDGRKLRFISILAWTVSREFGQLTEIYHQKNSNQKLSPNNAISPFIAEHHDGAGRNRERSSSRRDQR